LAVVVLGEAVLTAAPAAELTMADVVAVVPVIRAGLVASELADRVSAAWLATGAIANAVASAELSVSASVPEVVDLNVFFCIVFHCCRRANTGLTMNKLRVYVGLLARVKKYVR
jgi:hypothetical protein